MKIVISPEEQINLLREVRGSTIWVYLGAWPCVRTSILVSLYWHRETGRIIYIQPNIDPSKDTVSEIGIAPTMEEAIRASSMHLVQFQLMLPGK
jgi:hypothetical protein